MASSPVIRVSKAFPALRLWLMRQPFFTSTLLPMLPRRARWALRTMYFAPLDAIERLSGKRDPMVPPHRIRFSGSAGEDFVEHGQRLVDALTAVAGLTPESKILDIGSGLGRLAVPLTSTLQPPGRYDGLDVVKTGIDWCKAQITPRYPNFRFTVADVANGEYNPGGTISAAEYTLPYSDQHFDLVVLFSVFTHMQPAEMARYVSEIARMLQPGGHCFATYMLINTEVRAAVEAGHAIYDYTEHIDNYWLLKGSMEAPELNIAYDEQYVIDLFEKNGLKILKGIYYSKWSGLGDRAAPGQPIVSLGQDVVLATKV